MDRDEAIKLLRGGREGRQKWNQLRDAGEKIPSLEDADLRFTRLSYANLSGLDFRGANLSDAKMYQARFDDAVLDNTHMIRTDLTKASLKAAKLRGANLHGACLRQADLTDADLQGANLRSTSLAATVLLRADFRKALFYRTFIASDISVATGLTEVTHRGPSAIGIDSLLGFTGDLPEKFLRGCGLRNEETEYFRGVVGSPIRFYSCFISYSHENKSFARRLHDALQSEGIRCWLDEHQLLPGDEVHEVVNKAIRLWDKVLLCCSKDSLTSWWVDNEISSAISKERRLMKERKEKVLVLIPLDLDGYVFSEWKSEKKTTVLQRLVGDFKGWDRDNAKFELEFQKLRKALRTGDGARENAPPSQS